VDSVVALDLSGRLALGDGDELLKQTVRSLLTRGINRVVVNLAEVSYADSSGLGAIVSVFLEARKSGAAVKLHSPSKRLQALASFGRG